MCSSPYHLSLLNTLYDGRLVTESTNNTFLRTCVIEHCITILICTYFIKETDTELFKGTDKWKQFFRTPKLFSLTTFLPPPSKIFQLEDYLGAMDFKTHIQERESAGIHSESVHFGAILLCLTCI